MRIAAALLAAVALSSCDGTRSEPTVSTPVAGASLTLGGKKIDVSVILTEKERRHVVGRLTPPSESQGHLLAWPRERFMKKQHRILIATFEAAIVLAAVYFEPTCCVRGTLCGEAFFDGKPTSWWRHELGRSSRSISGARSR